MMKTPIHSYALLSILTLSSYGCGANGGGASLASATDLSGLSSSFASYEKMVNTPIYTAALSSMGSADLLSFYKSSVAASNNSTFRIGSHTFSHLKDFYSSLSDQETKNATKFKTPADLWKSIGFDSRAKVSIAQYNDGLSVYDRISDAYDSGKSTFISAEDSVLLAKVELVTLSQTLAASPSSLALAGPTININVNSGGVVNTGDSTVNAPQTTNVDCRSTNVAVVNQPQSGCGTGNSNTADNHNSASASASASATNSGQIAGGAAAGANGDSANVGSGNSAGNGNGAGNSGASGGHT